MPVLSPRENYLRALRHEETEYVPVQVFGAAGFTPDVAGCGLFAPIDRGNGSTNGYDGFGVRWVASNSAAGGQIPEPGDFILKDITRWKKDITIPDVEKYDWEDLARQEYALFNINRSTQAVGYASTNGIWERLAALMGFEEAMIAMVEEPEACNELFAAITDFKIALAKKVAKYYKADAFTNFDDIATERELFISPAIYRRLIKPHHARLNKAIKETGMIPIQHTCGRAELCIDDYIETGAEAWSAVQPTNNIAALLDKYGGTFAFEGGYDTTGKPGRPGATVPEIKAEVERCFRDYGKKKGFIFTGVVLAAVDSKTAAEQGQAIAETAGRLRYEVKK